MFSFLTDYSKPGLSYPKVSKQPAPFIQINYFGEEIPLSTWKGCVSSHGSFFVFDKPVFAPLDRPNRSNAPMFLAFVLKPSSKGAGETCVAICAALKQFFRNDAQQAIQIYGCTQGNKLYVFLNLSMDIICLLHIKNFLFTTVSSLKQTLHWLTNLYRPSARIPTLLDSRMQLVYDSKQGGCCSSKPVSLSSLQDACKILFFDAKPIIPSIVFVEHSFPRFSEIIQYGVWNNIAFADVKKSLERLE